MKRSTYFARLSEIFKLWELREISPGERNIMVAELNNELAEDLVQMKMNLGILIPGKKVGL